MLKRIRLTHVIAAVAALVIALPLLLVGLRLLWKVGFDNRDKNHTRFQPELVFNNAPEGTAYIDPLVKLDKNDDHYIDFTPSPQMIVNVLTDEYDTGGYWEMMRHLEVTEESDIAQLRRDGFVSLSLHYTPHAIVSFDADKRTYLMFEEPSDDADIDRIFEQFGGFRAAYVDKSGNVLGVTEPAVRVYDNTFPTTFIANGNTLTLVVNGIPKWQAAVLSGMTLAEFVLIAALAVLLVIVIMRRLFAEQEKIDRLA